LSADDNYYWNLVLRWRWRTGKKDAPASHCFLVHVMMDSKRNGTNR
jgi:hypothetical protein